MKTFEIDLHGLIIEVRPETDGTFLTMFSGEKFARLYPDQQPTGIIWESGDLDIFTAQIVGKLIEAHEMYVNP